MEKKKLNFRGMLDLDVLTGSEPSVKPDLGPRSFKIRIQIRPTHPNSNKNRELFAVIKMEKFG